MARPKKASRELQSIEECGSALGELGMTVSDLAILTGERDLAVAAASANFEPRMDEARAKRDDLIASLRNYYMSHLEDLEKDGRRSIQLANGVMGRRLSPPKLALANKSWTWGAVLVKAREMFGNRFLRLRDPELDKDLMKAELAMEQLRALGLKLDQDEAFYAEPSRLPEAS